MNKKIKHNIKYIFYPKTIAVVGASSKIGKIGNTIFRTLHKKFNGKVYAVNKQKKEIDGVKTYLIEELKKIDLAIIAIPAKYVIKTLEQLAKKGLKAAIIISGGFSEIGNYKDEEKIKQIANKYGIAIIGPNCMGIINNENGNDSVFLPEYKMIRPEKGDTSFISQSGAIGGIILDKMTNIGLAKFISYGNGAVINETDLLEYLVEDKKTHKIMMYIEGVKDGRRFFNILKKTKKPVIILKGGKNKKTDTRTHAGALAGNYEVYRAVFKQTRTIEAKTIEELFYLYKIFEEPKMKGKRIAVISNGGGLAILTSDEIIDNGLELAKFEQITKKQLRKEIPNYLSIKNPLDIGGDADKERFEKAIKIIREDKNVDAIIVEILFQTQTIDAGIVETIAKLKGKKPLVVVSDGSYYTQMYRDVLESYSIATFKEPREAVRALNMLYQWSN